MDAFTKLLERDYPVLTVAWARFGVMAMLYGAVSCRSFGWRMLRPQQMRMQCLRAGAVVFATLAFYQGLIFLPLTECIAIVFVAPILTALISSRYLGERATASTGAMLAGSFLGGAADRSAGWRIVRLGAAGQLMLTFAFRYAQAPLVASVGYTAIVAAVAIGWLMFGHVPDGWSLAGMAIIAAFAVVLVLRR